MVSHITRPGYFHVCYITIHNSIIHKFLGNFTDSLLFRIEDGEGNAWVASPEESEQVSYLTDGFFFFLSEFE